jgi:hypothetical protein
LGRWRRLKMTIDGPGYQLGTGFAEAQKEKNTVRITLPEIMFHGLLADPLGLVAWPGRAARAHSTRELSGKLGLFRPRTASERSIFGVQQRRFHVEFG